MIIQMISMKHHFKIWAAKYIDPEETSMTDCRNVLGVLTKNNDLRFIKCCMVFHIQPAV